MNPKVRKMINPARHLSRRQLLVGVQKVPSPVLEKSRLSLAILSLHGTHQLGFLGVLVRGQVDGPGLHHGAGEQVGQLGAKGRRHGLVWRRERRGHEERRGFRRRGDDVRGVGEEARSGGRVGRHGVVDGPHAGGSGRRRGGLMQLGLEFGLLFPAQTRGITKDTWLGKKTSRREKKLDTSIPDVCHEMMQFDGQVQF